MRLTVEQQIPNRVQKCAETNHLGSPRILYEADSTSRLHFLAGLLTLLIGALLIGVYYLFYSNIFSWWPTEQAYLVLGIGVAWLGIGCWILLPPLIAPKVRVFLCPKGLIYVRQRIEVIRWQQIEKFWKVVKLERQKQVKYTYNIRRNDGANFVLKPDLPYIDRLAGFLEREVTRNLLPHAIIAYEHGTILEFAGIAITREGINVKHEHQQLSWSEVEGIGINEATISIGRKGDMQAWITLGISGIPNVGVLKGLIEHILHSQATSPQIAAYDAGFTVIFGPLRLSKAGVSVNSSDEMIPWGEIGSLGIGESEVIMRRKGPVGEWYALPLWQITDVTELAKLLAHIF